MGLVKPTEGEARNGNIIFFDRGSLFNKLIKIRAQTVDTLDHCSKEIAILPNLAVVKVGKRVDCAGEGLALQDTGLQL